MLVKKLKFWYNYFSVCIFSYTFRLYIYVMGYSKLHPPPTNSFFFTQNRPKRVESAGDLIWARATNFFISKIFYLLHGVAVMKRCYLYSLLLFLLRNRKLCFYPSIGFVITPPKLIHTGFLNFSASENIFWARSYKFLFFFLR